MLPPVQVRKRPAAKTVIFQKQQEKRAKAAKALEATLSPQTLLDKMKATGSREITEAKNKDGRNTNHENENMF